MPLIRALPCASSVQKRICQPSQERAGTPNSCSAIASRPAVTCSPLATTTSYSSRGSCSGLICSVIHQLIGNARHRRDDHRYLVAFLQRSLYTTRDGLDALDVGDRCAAEFLDQPGHVLPVREAGAHGSYIARERDRRAPAPLRQNRRRLDTEGATVAQERPLWRSPS